MDKRIRFPVEGLALLLENKGQIQVKFRSMSAADQMSAIG